MQQTILYLLLCYCLLATSDGFLAPPRPVKLSYRQQHCFGSQTTWRTHIRQRSTILRLAPTDSYILSRIVYLRGLALVHFVAFLVAFRQNKQLIGDNGITPAKEILDYAEQKARRTRERRLLWRNSTLSQAGIVPESITKRWKRRIGRFADSIPAFVDVREKLWDRSDGSDRPLISLLWLCKDRAKLNKWLDGIALAGIVISTAILLLGTANVPMIASLWILQRSLMSIGGTWYGYGWEPQLNELAFHTLLLVPLLSLTPIPSVKVHPAVQYCIKWHLFRIMIGAGLIKFRSGDRKWKDLTTMYYFYETQPVPNPITRYLHWMPKWWHKGEVLINHFVEVVAPFALIIPGLPPTIRRAGALIQICFQAVLIGSGNLSFLNWLTIIPGLICLDDALLSGLFSHEKVHAATVAAAIPLSKGRLVAGWLFFCLIVRLSIPVVRNLLSPRQVMNGSFDKLRLVNTYGAFGTVDEVREELIISSSPDLENWREYEFKVKPGDVNRKPRFISPYHYRLDWQMWIASVLRSPDRSRWLYPLLAKLLEQDEGVQSLIARDPWKGTGISPKYIKVEKYRYTFHKRARGESKPPYWDRIYIGRFYPRQGVVSLEDLKALL